MTVSRNIRRRMINVLDKSWRESKNTHFVFSNFFMNRAVDEILSNNLVESVATNDVTTWRIRLPCWISKATCTHEHAYTCACSLSHTHKYVIFIAFPRQRWSQTLLSVVCTLPALFKMFLLRAWPSFDGITILLLFRYLLINSILFVI